MKWWRQFVLCGLAISAATSHGQDLATLRQRAQAAQGGDRAHLYIQVAQREVEEANAKFNAGEADRAQTQVKEAVRDAETSVETAITTQKRLKQTELSLHELARRLADIERAVSLDDRPPLKQAVEKLHQLDRRMLEDMFRKKQ